MAQVINTNSLSLMAQNNLNKSQSSLGTAIERLSSGLRINSAKDDAAGQAISNRFTANIKGLTQASRNANDGISLAQTTEGALNEVNDNLQNIRRLTVQSQNGSNSSSDLQSIQDEISQRLNEINRISEQTDFNGVKVLSGDQKLTIQVGANDNETIDIDLKNINAKTLGLDKFSVADQMDVSKVDTTALTKVDKMVAPTFDDTNAGTKKDIDGQLYSWDDAGTTKYFVQSKDGTERYTATIDNTSGKASYTSATDASATITGATKTVSQVKGGETDVSGLKAGESLHSFTDANGKAGYVVKSQDADGKDVYSKASVATDGKISKGAQLSTEAKTADPLAVLDNALSQVDNLRSSLGAVQNRFDSVINNLNSTVNNLSASQSRIQDADYATEVSNMSRANILQQAGTSVLAQANQSTQNVLTLLR
ncbi:FliC/FljB family flagellin [Serratia fonticola]|uniref:Flagellin n=1 Tax=Serratia fonticola TaxID=47917 RepID=A0ABY9PHG2_SERFO|nr:FliC/FljB family flagellin [Serratia fonticola]MDQ7212134.1 FliC/FljB family flagellin [Serratia fonticola]WMT12864.1 FliC/FljB family flagellin [Serratia fonticola]HBE9082688.1 FliC/FljB family flagellin [Serratia fonticola]HBE9092821.1 FliC/FljB family flagellin [Serratia fonticola]HBE9155106.1 FliC/FljB family flagellin [Serratia fonticola]